jgi:hypothetical protein
LVLRFLCADFPAESLQAPRNSFGTRLHRQE